MEFYENFNEENYVGCQCDDYCADLPNGGVTGCDD